MNVSLGDPAVERYAHDVALLLYVFVRVAELAGRSDVERLADGRYVPTLVPDNVLLAGQVQTEFTKAVDDATPEIEGAAVAVAEIVAGTVRAPASGTLLAGGVPFSRLSAFCYLAGVMRSTTRDRRPGASRPRRRWTSAW